MDFVISLGLLECHAPPRRTQQKSTAPPAAHPLGKHAKLGPPNSPTRTGAGQMPHGTSRSARAKPSEMWTLRDANLIDRQPSLAGTEAQRTRMLAQRHAYHPRQRANSHAPQSHAIFAPSSPLAFPLQTQLFSLHSSPAPNPTSRRFHLYTPPAYHRHRLPDKGASPWPFSTSG